MEMGLFSPPLLRCLGNSTDIAAGDFNGDGNVDVALVGDDNLRVVLGNGDGTFQPAITYSAQTNAATVATADLNHDGVPDLVVGGDHVMIFLANGDGTFGQPVSYGVGERFARIADFDSDGNAEVVAGGDSDIVVAAGKGDGTLSAPLVTHLGGNGFDSADFDSDGHP